MHARITRSGLTFKVVSEDEETVTLDVPEILGGPLTLPRSDVEICS